MSFRIKLIWIMYNPLILEAFGAGNQVPYSLKWLLFLHLCYSLTTELEYMYADLINLQLLFLFRFKLCLISQLLREVTLDILVLSLQRLVKMYLGTAESGTQQAQSTLLYNQPSSGRMSQGHSKAETRAVVWDHLQEKTGGLETQWNLNISY